MTLRISKSPPILVPPLLTEGDLSALLAVTVNCVRRWRRSGRLGPFVRVGHARVMRRETFEAWMRSHEA
jgi:hypothetical protein